MNRKLEPSARRNKLGTILIDEKTGMATVIRSEPWYHPDECGDCEAFKTFTLTHGSGAFCEDVEAGKPCRKSGVLYVDPET